MFNKSLFSTLLIASSGMAFFAHASSTIDNAIYLENRIGAQDKRYESFVKALDILEERNAKLLVETGTSRGGDRNFDGDGGSTVIFGDWAKQNDAFLFTVDIDSGALSAAAEASLDSRSNIEFICSDSIKYLSEFGQQIDFLYLDSYDFNAWDPEPSQNHHLYEIEAAYDKLHDNSVVMVDDCDLPYGGKGKLVIEFLLEKGWHIIYQGYQVILVKN